jgi:hypothetical protein
VKGENKKSERRKMGRESDDGQGWNKNCEVCGFFFR